MENVDKAVEAKPDEAANQEEEVKTEEVVDASDDSKTDIKDETPDYEALLEEKDEEIAKITDDRDNYKQGMLVAKGKADPEVYGQEDELDINTLVKREVKEALFDAELTQKQKEKDEILKQALRENREMKLSLQNKDTISNAPAGAGNEETAPVTDNFLSDNQIRELKTKGWDDKKIEKYKKNLRDKQS